MTSLRPSSTHSAPIPSPALSPAMPTTDPPRRRFGSTSKIPLQPSPALQTGSSNPNVNLANGSASSSRSITPTPASQPPTALPNLTLTPSPPSPESRQPRSFITRSRSSSSTDAQPQQFPFDPSAAAKWLQTWAPRGEGRGREFLSNTLNGVATVAGQVGGAVKEGVGQRMGRPGSFVGGERPEVLRAESADAGGGLADGRRRSSGGGGSAIAINSNAGFGVAAPGGGGGGVGKSLSPPPGPQHTASTPVLPGQGTKKPLQPANLARLGPHAASSTTTSQAMSPPSRPPIPHPTSTSSLPPSLPSSTSTPPSQTLHGPSHLNPNAQYTHSRSMSSSTALSRNSSAATRKSQKSWGMPYKIGFQAKGVVGDRSWEFGEARRKAGEEREREEGRLGRRWAKLVDLHFNPTTPTPSSPSTLPMLSRSGSSTFSLASQAQSGGDKRRSILSMEALEAWKPKEMWRGIKGVTGPVTNPNAEEQRKRAAEQAIVKWEDDADAKKCRICQSTFSLSNRKHHCRLCGRLVCSLPPTPPTLLAVQQQLFSPSTEALPDGTRKEKCSLLLVADWKTGRGEEVEEGFVGWMTKSVNIDEDGGKSEGVEDSSSGGKRERRRASGRMSTGSAASRAQEEGAGGMMGKQAKEVQVRGVRVCRECWSVVSRKQKIADRQRVPAFARLYAALRTLQVEIEDTMPDFEDQLSELTDTPTHKEVPAETLALHKHLLTLLAQYEHLSKRLSGLPCADGSGQQQVQSAVARTAATFLAREMAKVQVLPKLQKEMADAKRKSMAIIETTLAEQLRLEGVKSEEAEDVAVELQPLLEQEAQLEAMIADANAQRKYEDSKALTEALLDIRNEIGRITSRAVVVPS